MQDILLEVKNLSVLYGEKNIKRYKFYFTSW
jgi:hypothetical protein